MNKILSLFIFTTLFFANISKAQTGNFVFPNAEAVNFGIINLAIPGGQTWATNRSTTPGYFSTTNGANYNAVSDVANINGYVKKYGNEAFTFPVGTGSDLRTLTISAPTTATDAYATAWILGNPSGNLDPTMPNAGSHSITSVTAPIFAVSPVGQWDWQVGTNLGNTGTGAGLTITVSIPDMTSFAVASKLRLVGWDGTSWIDLSGMATASGNIENSTLSGTMVAGITAIGIGNLTNPLPVKLENFTGISKDCNTTLNWKTTQEINSLQFDIEQSIDGIVFNKIKSVNASGNSIVPIQYEITIPQTEKNIFYRLKLLDINGSFNYSNIVRVTSVCTIKDLITIYPNPLLSNAVLNLNISTTYNGKAYILCLNSIGQIMSKHRISLIQGINTTTIDFDNYAKGTYILQIVKENGEKIGGEQKLIK